MRCSTPLLDDAWADEVTMAKAMEGRRGSERNSKGGATLLRTAAALRIASTARAVDAEAPPSPQPAQPSK